MSCHRRVQQFWKKMGRWSSDKNLDLNNCALNAVDIMELTTVISLLPDLEEIDLSWNDSIGGALEPLALQFKHLQELKVLQLNSCRLTTKDVACLGEALEGIPHLEILDLSWNTGIGGTLSLLTSKILKGSKLQTLKVTDCGLTPEDGKSVAQLLSRIYCLKILDLSINRKLGYSLKNIAQELQFVSGLQVLNLNTCGLEQDGFQSLDTAFQYLSELRTLDVSCNKLIGGVFQCLAGHLASLSNLEILNLHQCCITEEDMVVLSQIIPLLSNLQELNLSSNTSVGISTYHLLSRLRFLPKLTSVLLNNCALQHDSFVFLAEAASHLPELKILDLSSNKCVGGNLKLILKALHLDSKIQELRLSSCSLVDEDLVDLALIIQAGHLAQLKHLDFSYNNSISDQGWETFCGSTPALGQLSELDISRRPSSRCSCGEWLGKLLSALSQLLLFTDLELNGWLFSVAQQKLLEDFRGNKKRNVRFNL
ncbi:leucine-rich repeat-containing protein 31 [Python bivittatus]|uniref:Leucine-rich repeat-containing protein 31 n=1 Tax=Python bivittatus TaxID=176946 RepID=A0A9F5N0R1_PYTBI|nr:leucine-rich repeat-containing protein 31 [Python bivittatus]XP_025031416.1 leucine-rich repeat-containing protein 31 [Python bivittatus]